MARGYLKLVILNILSKRESSGYDIMKYVKETTEVFSPSPGSLYPALRQLREEKLVDFKIVGRRKVYHITKQGKAYLKDLLSKRKNFYEKVVKRLHLRSYDDGMLTLISEIGRNEDLASAFPKFINLTNKAYLIFFKNRGDKRKLNVLLKKYRKFVGELKTVDKNEKD